MKISDFLEKGLYYDIEISFNGYEPMKLHKEILAPNSEYFKKKFEEKFMETDIKKIEIKDVKDPSGKLIEYEYFNEFIRYCYGLEVIDEDEAKNLSFKKIHRYVSLIILGDYFCVKNKYTDQLLSYLGNVYNRADYVYSIEREKKLEPYLRYRNIRINHINIIPELDIRTSIYLLEIIEKSDSPVFFPDNKRVILYATPINIDDVTKYDAKYADLIIEKLYLQKI